MGPLSEEALRAALIRLSVDGPAVVHALTGSTNDDAKALAREGAQHGALVLADAQTRGRGRHGNAWVSPPHENLYASLVLRPTVAPHLAPPFALIVGLVVAELCEEFLPEVRLLVKWPNDVVVVADGARLRKLAGVLVETQMRGAALNAMIVGVGLNVRARVFAPEIADAATSLALLGATAVTREELAARLVRKLLAACWRFEEQGLRGFHEGLQTRDALRGRTLRVGEVEGEAAGIDADGALLVKTPRGVERVIAGHVELR